MNFNELIKSFFTSKKSLRCPECKTEIIKDIIIYGTSAFNEEYMLALEWHQDIDANSFILDEDHGNKSPDDYIVLNRNSHNILSIQDLHSICAYLSKIGYKITDIRLSLQCISNTWSAVCFKHMTDMEWSNENKNIIINNDYVKFADYSINYDYRRNNSRIVDRTTSAHTSYNFDYILNINSNKHSSIKNKIKQTLLLG